MESEYKTKQRQIVFFKTILSVGSGKKKQRKR